MSDTASRFGKYLISGILAATSITIVLYTFSYYAARRDIDNELKATGTDSFEWLYQAQRNNTALALESLDARCTERMQLTAFRRLQSKDAESILEAYSIQYKARLALINVFKTGNGLVNVGPSLPFLTNIDFDMNDILKYTKPISGVTISDDKYIAFENRVIEGIKTYNEVNAKLASKIDPILRGKAGDLLLRSNSIISLESRIKRLHQDMIVLTRPQENLVVKYRMWTEPFIGSVPARLLNDLSIDPTVEDNNSIQNIDCLALEQSYRIATGIDLRSGPHSSIDNNDGGISVPKPPNIFRYLVLAFFTGPPVAQTLFVTLLMGALGAATLNLLRLSSRGWWGTRADPKWGEVIYGPFLGAVAALGIFLIASAGLLLGTGPAGQDGTNNLSALFIGLLGFLSGLLYDEAFGQVRRVGSRFFGGEGQEANEPTDADRDLARILTDAKAPVAAALLLAARAGENLAKDNEFTFFVPPDSDLSRNLFEACLKTQTGIPPSELRAWIDGHVSSERLSLSDLMRRAGDPRPEVTLRSGKKIAVALVAGQLTIAGASILGSENPWHKGIIHLLNRDFDLA